MTHHIPLYKWSEHLKRHYEDLEFDSGCTSLSFRDHWLKLQTVSDPTDSDGPGEAIWKVFAGDPRLYEGEPPDLPVPDGMDVSLTQEDSIDKALKAIRLKGEIQLGDKRFDDTVYINTQAPDQWIHRALGSAKTRSAILQLMDAGFTDIKLTSRGPRWDHRSAFIVASGKRAAASMSREQMDALITGLAELALALPQRQSNDGVRKMGCSEGALFFGMMLHQALMLISVAVCLTLFHLSWQYRLFSSDLFQHTMVAGLILATLMMVPVVYVHRGRSNAGFVVFIFAGGLYLGNPLLFYTTARTLNGALDSAEASTVPAKIIERWDNETPQEPPTTFKVKVAPQGLPAAEFDVTPDQYNALSTGTCTVRVRQGALGYPWLESIQPPPHNPNSP